MPDPEAICVYAVSFSWTNDIFYILPHFSMLERVLQKIQKDNTDAVVITSMCPIYPRFFFYC